MSVFSIASSAVSSHRDQYGRQLEEIVANGVKLHFLEPGYHQHLRTRIKLNETKVLEKTKELLNANASYRVLYMDLSNGWSTKTNSTRKPADATAFLEVELDVFGLSPGCASHIDLNVDTRLFKSQTIRVSGTAERTKFPVSSANSITNATTSVLVFEATSNSAIELLKLKVCKLERSLAYLLAQRAISAGDASADILDVVVFAGIATQVAGDDAATQLGAFVDTNKDALPLVHTLARHGKLAFANIPVHGAEYITQLHNEVEQLRENVDQLRVVVEESDQEREREKQEREREKKETAEEFKRVHAILLELQEKREVQPHNIQPLIVTINSNVSPSSISTPQSSSNTVLSNVTAHPGSNVVPHNTSTIKASSNVVINSYSNFSITSDPDSHLPIIKVDGLSYPLYLGTSPSPGGTSTAAGWTAGRIDSCSAGPRP